MNRLFFFLLLAGMLLSAVVKSLEPQSFVDELETVIKSGFSRELTRYFDNGVELNINGVQGQYSKSQAELVLRDFFKKYPAQQFKIIHQAQQTSKFINYIGNYQTGNERFKILIKGQFQEQELKIFSMEILRD